MTPRYTYGYSHVDTFLGQYKEYDLWIQTKELGGDPPWIYVVKPDEDFEDAIVYCVQLTKRGKRMHRDADWWPAAEHAISLLEDPSVSPNSRKIA